MRELERMRETMREAAVSEKRLAYVCSPYRGDTEYNVRYARELCRHAIDAGYVPIAPHLMYPGILDDDNADERQQAMQLNSAILHRCDVLVLGRSPITEGMAYELSAFNKKIRVFPIDYKPEGHVSEEPQKNQSHDTASTEKETIEAVWEPVWTCGKCGVTIRMARFPDLPHNWKDSLSRAEAIDEHNATFHPEKKS